MIDWYSLQLALCDALGVLIPACIVAFVLDMLVLGASDCIPDKEDY